MLKKFTFFCQSASPGEPLLANFALVKLLVRVQNLVDFKGLQVLIGLVAVLADVEGPLVTVMDLLEVVIEQVFAQKDLVAQFASV